MPQEASSPPPTSPPTLRTTSPCPRPDDRHGVADQRLRNTLGVEQGTIGAPAVGEAPVQAPVEDLLGQLTTAEKAGQLTQYFYFGPPGELKADGSSAQAGLVEAALQGGEAGSPFFVTDTAEINRLQRLTVEGNRHGIPALLAST